jgi:DNA-binding GntR family transcriptional regulator
MEFTMAMRRSRRAEQIAGEILSLARREGLEPGARLIEQRLAQALGVSRGPVRVGLKALESAGLITGARNRGYVLAESPSSRSARGALAAADAGEESYRRIADDRFNGRLPDVVSEAELMRRYDVPRAELLRLLDRIASEGWVTRTPGYGWRFADTLSSPEAYNQTLAFRAVIEPAALAEPAYHLAPEVIERLRTQQIHMRDTGLETVTIAEIFRFGCAFHEEIIRGSGNPFYVEALRRVNAIRRLFAYHTFADTDGMRRHIREHLRLLDLIAAGRMADAGALMRRHLARSPQVRDGLSEPAKRRR